MSRSPRRLLEPSRPNRIAEWRVTRGLSQDALADRMGTSKQSVSRHEHTNKISLEELERYAAALGVRVEELLPQSMRVPERLANLVRRAERLPDDKFQELDGLSEVMARQAAARPGRLASGLAEDDEPFRHSKN